MFEISERYLEDEVRDGFYIPSIAKRAWAAELSILHELNRICEKYAIRYFADWGSFLGAVRHQGFIPWDDDLDICMFRSDLNRFIEVAEKELPEGFEIHSFLNNDYSWKFIFNVVNTERMNFTPEFLKTHYNFPYMATIDIFVIDNVYDDEEKEEKRREKVKYILEVADTISEENYKDREINKLILEIEALCNVNINKNVSFIELKRQLYKITQDIISEYSNENSKYVVQQIPWGIYKERKYDRDIFDGVVKLPFEDTYICVPKKYDRVLRNKYGNYWEIHMGAGGHGYPYYNGQKESLGLPKDADYIPHYKFDLSFIENNCSSNVIGGLSGRSQTIEAIEQFKYSPEYAGEFDRETVVFLPFNGKYWDRMKPFYEEELVRENVDVFVVPLPYYYKEYNGAFKDEAQYDLSQYPEELPIYLIEQLDLEAMFPDRIYIQNPYDEYNMCMSVPKEYYAANIRNLTRKLIYVPWFEISDFIKDNYPSYYNMQYYCTVPGVVLSDVVIVNSEVVRERYIEKLCEFAGEETKDIWEEKIVIREFSKDENTVSSQKKIMLYYTSSSTILEHGKKYIEKINKNLEIFKDNSKSISVFWQLDKGDMGILRECDESLYNEIISIRKNAEAEGIVYADGGMPSEALVDRCCAYYGDPSHIAKDFCMKKKPVMISNVEV